jgi:hypothetical protein
MYANPGTNSYFNSYSSLEPEHAVKVRKYARLLYCGQCSVAVPGSGVFLTPGSGIGFPRIPKPYGIFESIKTIFSFIKFMVKCE